MPTYAATASVPRAAPCPKAAAGRAPARSTGPDREREGDRGRDAPRDDDRAGREREEQQAAHRERHDLGGRDRAVDRGEHASAYLVGRVGGEQHHGVDVHQRVADAHEERAGARLPQRGREPEGGDAEAQPHAAGDEQPLWAIEALRDRAGERGGDEHADAHGHAEQAVAEGALVQRRRDEPDLHDVDRADGQDEERDQRDQRAKHRVLEDEPHPRKRLAPRARLLGGTRRHPVEAEHDGDRDEDEEGRGVHEQRHVEPVGRDEEAADEGSGDPRECLDALEQPHRARELGLRDERRHERLPRGHRDGSAAREQRDERHEQRRGRVGEGHAQRGLEQRRGDEERARADAVDEQPGQGRQQEQGERAGDEDRRDAEVAELVLRPEGHREEGDLVAEERDPTTDGDRQDRAGEAGRDGGRCERHVAKHIFQIFGVKG